MESLIWGLLQIAESRKIYITNFFSIKEDKMPRSYHILFGFDECAVSKQVITTLKSRGVIVEVAYRSTKSSIQDYVSRYTGLDTIIIREKLGQESFSATELAALNDVRGHNVIVLVDDSHHGTSFMQVLYSAGITSAILVNDSAGATDTDILNLILHPRNNKKAREYYGMTTMKAQVNLLTSDSYSQNFAFLMDEKKGVNIIDRYVVIVNRLPVDQAVSFTRRLPAPTLKKLMQYEEFYRVMSLFAKRGYKLKYKKPRNLKRGMTDETFQSYINGRSQLVTPIGTMSASSVQQKKIVKAKPQKKEVKKPVRSVPVQKAVPKKTTKKEKVNMKVVNKKQVSKIQNRNGNGAFFSEEDAPTKIREKKVINWKLLLGIFIAGVLLLGAFYFGLRIYLMR